MTVTTDVSVAYLGSSALQLADPRDDVRGMVAVDPQGLRLGEVEDVVVDIAERRVRLLLVRSGGILGLPDSRTLVPVTSITTEKRPGARRTHARLRPPSRRVERVGSRRPANRRRPVRCATARPDLPAL